MADLATYAPPGSVVLLCRPVGDRVLCIHQATTIGTPPAVSYERGRPMPLLYGATSKILLAYYAPRRLKTLFDTHAREIEHAGLGATLEAFRAKMVEWRKAGSLVTRGEVDAGSVGIAAPILDPDRLGLEERELCCFKQDGGSHHHAACGARCRGRGKSKAGRGAVERPVSGKNWTGTTGRRPARFTNAYA